MHRVKVFCLATVSDSFSRFNPKTQKHFVCMESTSSLKWLCLITDVLFRVLVLNDLDNAPAPSAKRICEYCSGQADIRTGGAVVQCIVCEKSYHSLCLDGYSPESSSDWTCPDCKICPTCDRSFEGEECLSCEDENQGFCQVCEKILFESE